MKARYIIISAAIMLLTGCNEDTTSTKTNVSDGITGRVDNGMEKTRSTMIDSPMQGIIFNWEQNDAIGVFDGEFNNAKFTASEITDGGSTAVFKSDGNVPKAAFLAYYPYSANVQRGSGDVLTLTMPATQRYIEHEFKAQPDASANIMVGQGVTNTVTFKNVFAILQVGYVATAEDAVQKLVFSDLSGQPVSGAFTVTVDNYIPTATFPASGEGSTITLDCGSGVSVSPDDVVSFFLVVPAREYAKGFKIDFVLASGNTDSRTIGSKAGKTLLRSMVYSIGDVSVIKEKDYTVNFGEAGGTIMDDDMMAMVMSIENLGYMDFDDESGSYYEIVMKRGSGIKKGQTLVINRISEALPHGLIGRVSEIASAGGADVVRVMQFSDAAKAFKSLVIGKSDIMNEDGTLNEEAMTPMDLTRHFLRFEPEPSSEDDVEVSYGAPTRATASANLSTPRLVLTFKSDKESSFTTIGATAGLKLAVGGSISDYTLNYIAGSITPSIKFDMEVHRKKETPAWEKSKKLGRLCFTPITIGPLVAVPFVDLSLFISLQGYAEIVATWDYTLGVNVGFSYLRYYTGDEAEYGLTGRISNRSDGFPNLSVLFPDKMSVNFGAEAKGGVKMKVGLSFYRVIDLGTDFKAGVLLNAGTTLTGNFNNGEANAGLTMSPFAEGDISANSKSFKMASIEFDPFWSRLFYPWVYTISKHPQGNKVDVGTSEFPYYIKLYGRLLTDMQVNYEIYRHPKDTRWSESSERIQSGLLDYYQGSSVLPGGVQAPYDDLVINKTFNLKVDKNYTYSIVFYCTPTDSKSLIPSFWAPSDELNRIEIRRETDKYTQSDGTYVEKENIVIDDCNARVRLADGIWTVVY